MKNQPRTFTRDDLLHFHPRHSTFVGIDSDGCVFDTMEVKQKQHFHPLIISAWGLERIGDRVRQAAEFFNLHSRWRGQNRFVELLLLFQALPKLPGVLDSGVSLPPYDRLAAYVQSGQPLGNPSLAEEVKRTNDPDLQKVLQWSLEINRHIDENMDAIPPFTWARKSIERVAHDSDLVVVSQTPAEALVKEWELHGLAEFAAVIAGQELGTKCEHLRLAAEGHYPAANILMIGDAPGDLRAARDSHALFYPINPGSEEESWRRFHRDIYPLFLEGAYGGECERQLIAEFEALLPDKTPWG